MPLLEQTPPPPSVSIPITRIFYTDLDAIRQQLLPHSQWTIYDTSRIKRTAGSQPEIESSTGFVILSALTAEGDISARGRERIYTYLPTPEGV